MWVGNLPAGATYQALLAHAQTLTNATWAEIPKGKNTGLVGFSTEAEAKNAVVTKLCSRRSLGASECGVHMVLYNLYLVLCGCGRS